MLKAPLCNKLYALDKTSLLLAGHLLFLNVLPDHTTSHTTLSKGHWGSLPKGKPPEIHERPSQKESNMVLSVLPHLRTKKKGKTGVLSGFRR